MTGTRPLHDRGAGDLRDIGDLLRVGPGFRLADVDTASTPGYRGGKRDGAADLAAGVDALDDLQERLFARSRVQKTDAAVLLVLQAMDSAGKGGIVRHVVGAVDPQGVSLTAFKKPTDEELDRSHYEDVLVGRVRQLAPAAEIERRYDAINAFEERVVTTGTRIVKVMLHISADEQKKRLTERLDRADKHWKFTPGDVDERMLWPRYQHAYQVMFERTSTAHAPWYVVPADRKWYARLAVQHLLRTALEDIDPQWPAATYDIAEQRARLAAT